MLLIIACVVTLVLVLHGQKAGEKIRLGCISPFSGNGAVYGEALKRGFAIALDELRAEAPELADRIDIVYEDDQLEAQKGVSAAKKLIEIDKVVLVVGPFTSNVALAIAPVAESSKKLLIIPTATNYRLRKAGRYIFRVCPSDDLQGGILADYVVDSLKTRKAGVLYMNTDYGVGLRDSFAARFKGRGGEIVLTEAFEKDATDVRAQLTRIKSSGVSLVFLPSNYREAVTAVRQARELGLSIRFLGTDGVFEPKFLELTKGASEGMLVTTMAWDPQEDVAKAFAQKFERKFGEKPGAYSALCYDALKCAIECVRGGKTDSESLRKRLAGLTIRGATGIISFDEDGQVRNKTFSIYVVKDGQFVPAK